MFEIDTGTNYGPRTGHIDRADIVMLAATDAANSDDPQDIAQEAGKMIVRYFWDAKKPDTVRRHLKTLWPIIAPMAETAPATFDHILTEFAERLSEIR